MFYAAEATGGKECVEDTVRIRFRGSATVRIHVYDRSRNLT